MTPSPAARLFAALLGARVAFGLAYLAGALRRAPIPWYHPVARAWSFGSAPAAALGPDVPMEWYGRTAVALAAAAIAFAIVWIAAGRGPGARALARPPVVLALARGGALVMLLDFAYFGWVMMHPTPTPLPLPLPGACPP